MDLAGAAPNLNDIGERSIGSCALLATCEERVSHRLPARVEELADLHPDDELDGRAEMGVNSVAVHDFFLDSGAHAPRGPSGTPCSCRASGRGRRARWVRCSRRRTDVTTVPLVDEMTSLVVAPRP